MNISSAAGHATVLGAVVLPVRNPQAARFTCLDCGPSGLNRLGEGGQLGNATGDLPGSLPRPGSPGGLAGLIAQPPIASEETSGDS